jgi:hypothetical protein
MFRPFRLALTVTSLGVLLALLSLSVAAQAPLTSPTIPVATNTAASFIGAGFRVGEIVSLWTTAPDASVAPLNSTTADSQGTISVNVSFPTAGTWGVTAHGQTSGVEVIGTYAVGTTSGLPASGNVPGMPTSALPTQGGSILSAPAPATFPPVALDVPVTFTGTGFAANEPTAFWETAPTSSVAAIQGPQTVDATGSFTTSVAFTTPGLWQVTAHGINSGHEVIGRYMVGGDGTIASALPSSAGAPYTLGGTPTVPSVTTTVGASVSLPATGFTVGETVSAWATAPDSSVTALNQIAADSNGAVTVVTSFPTPGLWQVTVHGITSGHEVIGQYQVTAA